MSGRPRVVLTDHPWPGIDVETNILGAAGYDLVAGPEETPTAAEVEAMVAGNDPMAIMTCWAQVSAKAIASPKDLRVVGRMGVGLDNIVVPAVTARGGWVVNVPDYCVEEVSDHVVAMLLDFWRGITKFDLEVKRGRWQPATARLKRVANMTVGIIGYGRIGGAAARKLARGFGCRVQVMSRRLLKEPGVGRELEKGITVATIETMQRECDAIVLNAPLTDETRYIVNDAFLAACKRKPLIVNVSRGAMIDNAALVRALNAGQISGAALDVVEGEPTPPVEVVRRPDVIVTPHIAFSSDASILELRQRITEDIVRVLRGELPRHPCNDPRQGAGARTIR
jgi:D-3-phosphoglycerate dehydrogenase / 2-oxoglutarate reductase